MLDYHAESELMEQTDGRTNEHIHWLQRYCAAATLSRWRHMMSLAGAISLKLMTSRCLARKSEQGGAEPGYGSHSVKKRGQCLHKVM